MEEGPPPERRQLTVAELIEQVPDLLGEFKKERAAAEPVEIIDNLGRTVAVLYSWELSKVLESLVRTLRAEELELARIVAKDDRRVDEDLDEQIRRELDESDDYEP